MSKLQEIGKDSWGRSFYYMNVTDDIFIHFTTTKRAPEIIRSKKLLLNSPNIGMGVYGVFAVSLTYGEHVPEVSLTHINKWIEEEDSEITAIIFKTNTVPKKLGTVDEVAFGEQDVNLINPKEISKESAIHRINNSPIDLPEEGMVIYDEGLIPQLSIVNKEASQSVVLKFFRTKFE